jgi:predicted amidohydrolase YtcJ
VFRKMPLLVSCAFGAALVTGCPDGPEPADLVLLGGKIVTLENEQPEAEALAARDGRIVALGSTEQVRAHVGPATRVIDLEGRLAVPGFIEGHGHFTGLGRSLTTLDLTGARSWEEIVELVGRAADTQEPGSWILGWGWHQEKWDVPPATQVDGYPTHDLLSRAVPDHPVMLKHAAGSHGGIVNSKTMELCGIGPETPDPPGGTILRDAEGRPTGALRENAYEIVLDAHEVYLARRTADEVEAQARREIELADNECLSKGVTSFQDAGSDFETVDRLRAVAEAGELGIRLWVMLGDEIDRLESRAAGYRTEGAADGHLTVRAIKQAMDGALGTHGAWLLEPYSDLPSTSGLNTSPLEELERAARVALEHGFQLAVHAIGDRANRETLDIFERALAGRPDGRDLRWRVEHAQHLSAQDIPRFSELGVIASMQGVHCTSDGPWVPLRLGAGRAEEGAYVWRRLIDSGAVVSNGTDTPVEDVDPIANFHASVTRRTADGTAFYPDQRMTRIEALRSYTIDAAYAAFEDDVKGSLRPGKLADVTVLSRDILTVAEDRISDTEVLFTIVGGRVLYEREPPGGSS